MPVAMSLLLFLHHVSLLLACRAACPSTTQTLEIILSRVCIFFGQRTGDNRSNHLPSEPS